MHCCLHSKNAKTHELEHEGENVGKEYIKVQKKRYYKEFIILNSSLQEIPPPQKMLSKLLSFHEL